MSEHDLSKEITEKSEEVQEILTSPPHWMIRTGNSVFFLILIFILTISWFIKYPDTISSDAIITTRVPPQKFIAKIDGRLENLLVGNNDTVTRNQPLFILENSANYKHIFILDKKINSIALQELKDSIFTFDSLSFLDLGEVESDFSLFLSNYNEFKLNKIVSPDRNSLKITHDIQKEINNRINVIKEQIQITRKKISLEHAELSRVKALYEQDLESLKNFELAQLKYLESKNTLRNNEITMSQLSQNLLDIKLNINESSYEQSLKELTLFSNVILSFNKLQKSLKEWKLKYSATARIAGRITFIEIWNENQFVKAGDLLLTIVPTEKMNYIARLKTTTRNLGKVQKGQKVNIRLNNYPVEQYGVLIGTISNISLIPNNEGFHIIEVELPNLISSYQIELSFSQEMNGYAEIVTEDLLLAERIFYKFRSLFDKSSGL